MEYASMLKSLLFIAGMVTAVSAAGQPNVITQDVKLNNATVFLRGAELFNSATLTLPAGVSELVLSNVAKNINPASLSVMLDNEDVIIRSINLNNELKAPVYSGDALALKTNIDSLKQEIAQLSMFSQINNEQLELLRGRGFFGNGDALTQEQVVQKLAFIREQMTKIYSEQTAYAKQISDKTEVLNRLQAQFSELTDESNNWQPQIVVNVEAKKAVTAELDIVYITTDAAWSADYDIRAVGLNKPVMLTYKANVIQNTGMDWDQVKLTLSSADPVQSIAPPKFNPWYLSLAENYAGGGARVDNRAHAPALMMEKREDARPVNRGIADFVSVDNNGISLNYTIAQPFSLPSSDKPRSLTIKQTALSGKYHYISRPKLDEHVYLQANIENAASLNLLSGKANIYFANSYIGTSLINASTLKDELIIPLGMNKDIQVSRTVNAKLKKQPGILGSSVEQNEGYIISLKSVHKTPVTVSVFDQLPVSQDDNIQVKDIEIGNGKQNKTTGEIEWEVVLAPQQKVELPLNYTLKYPKDKPIRGL